MTPYESQYAWICEHVLSVLPGADPAHVQRTFRRKIDHFLQESSSWIDNKTFQSDAFGNVKLDFSHIEAQPVWIHGVANDRFKLGHITNVPTSLQTQTGSAPQWYSNTPYPDVLVLHPAPLEGQVHTVTVRAALKMEECSKADIPIPDWIFSRYKEAIRAGVLGNMMMEPGKSYSSTAQAKLHEMNYKNWIIKARDEARRGFGFHESEWAYPRSFLA